MKFQIIFVNHTVILIAHREETLRKMDKIITIKEGKIQWLGDLEIRWLDD